MCAATRLALPGRRLASTFDLAGDVLNGRMTQPQCQTSYAHNEKMMTLLGSKPGGGPCHLGHRVRHPRAEVNRQLDAGPAGSDPGQRYLIPTRDHDLVNHARRHDQLQDRHFQTIVAGRHKAMLEVQSQRRLVQSPAWSQPAHRRDKPDMQLAPLSSQSAPARQSATLKFERSGRSLTTGLVSGSVRPARTDPNRCRPRPGG